MVSKMARAEEKLKELQPVCCHILAKELNTHDHEASWILSNLQSTGKATATAESSICPFSDRSHKFYNATDKNGIIERRKEKVNHTFANELIEMREKIDKLENKKELTITPTIKETTHSVLRDENKLLKKMLAKAWYDNG